MTEGGSSASGMDSAAAADPSGRTPVARVSLASLLRHLRAPRRWRGGPAWLVMIANIDAASILTALASGASFRYDLVWFLIVLTVPLFFIQEAAGRIGAVAGKGLGELARERFSSRVAAGVALSMAVGDIAIYVAEYAGIALGLGLFGIPPLISLPIAFAVHLALVAQGRYAWVERVLIVVSLGVVAGLAVEVLHQRLLPYSPIAAPLSPSFLFLLAANAGAVVMPFMLFFQSSATAAKRTSLAISRQSTLVGSVVSEVLMIVLVVIGAGIGISLDLADRAGFASDLVSALGHPWAYLLGLGLVAAAFLALVVVSLGSAWGLTEAFALSSRATLWIYALESVPAVVVPLLFPRWVSLVLGLMVAMVFILIVPAVMVGRLASDPAVMGTGASRGSWRAAYWGSLAFVVAVGTVGVIASL
jgi:manganese transport protein